ncbi:S26 family signal peptidase [Embleya scabrispora]|uniref:S26 family signal peptidase n=1 Tax=Embleya scabrispora TaxID=159449 RepID=UPI00068D1792|nr:S26 family signal peptidase [Embleya scabrispora]
MSKRVSSVVVPVSIAVTVAVAAGLGTAALIRRRYVIVSVQGHSMTPTLTDGERVIVRRTPLRAIGVGRLVVARPPDDGRWSRLALPAWLIKRAAAVPGDAIPRSGAPALRDLSDDRVPEHRIVLFGDNPAQSLDSRYCGYFRDDQILGVVVGRLPGAAPLGTAYHQHPRSGRPATATSTATPTAERDLPPWRI